MIELNPYHTPKSPEILNVWQTDQFLLTKIATLAYKILLENVAIFLSNQSARVRNFFKKDRVIEPKLATPKPAPLPIPNYPAKLSDSIQSTVFLALIARGLGSFFSNSIPLREKAAHCGKLALLKPINDFKQSEIKNFAFASAVIPALFCFGMAIYNEPKNLSLVSKVKNAAKKQFQVVKKQFSVPHLVFYTSMIGLAFISTYFGDTIYLTSKSGFDASGHLMFKTILAPIVGAALAYSSNFYPNLSKAYFKAYIMTDAIFLRNTVSYCHTALESIAGYVWGIGIITLSGILANTYALKNPPRLAKRT